MPSASTNPAAAPTSPGGEGDPGGQGRPVAENLTRALGRTTHPRQRLLIAGFTAFLAVPLVVALVVLRNPRWYPLLDMSQIELRLRDVWSVHAPLVGLAGRIGEAGDQGSHPGPLGFYAVWPVYKLFGSTSWAMEASSVALHTSAVAITLWIANRRGGVRLLLVVTAVLAVLLRTLGAELLTQPWNPYVPVLYWIVFLFAVWSVCCDDLLLLPVAVVTGSLCAQSEVAFIGLTVVLGLGAMVVASARAYSKRGDPDERRRFRVAALMTAGAVVLVWIPPLIQELTTAHGNLSVLFNYFISGSSEPTVGLGRAIRQIGVLVNPVTLLSTPITDADSTHTATGYVFLAVWAGSAVVAWRLRARPLIWLHAVLAIALAAGLFSISRIYGILWYYLVLWGWGINALMVLAVGWTIALLIGRRLADSNRDRVQRSMQRALLVAILVVTTAFAFEASHSTNPTPRLGAQLGDVVNPTVRALERAWGRDGSRRERYLVTFTDPNSLGAQGFGLVNELEREGFDVGLVDSFRTGIVPHRVVDPAEATAIVHLSVGSDIPIWRAKSGVREVAFSDPRSAEERARYTRVRARVIKELEAAGLFTLTPDVDGNQIGVALDERVPEKTRAGLAELGRIGLPIAIFLAPATEHS